MAEKKIILEEILSSVKSMSVEEYNALFESISEDENIKVMTENYRVEISSGGQTIYETVNRNYSPQKPIVFSEANSKNEFAYTYSLVA